MQVKKLKKLSEKCKELKAARERAEMEENQTESGKQKVTLQFPMFHQTCHAEPASFCGCAKKTVTALTHLFFVFCLFVRLNAFM